MNKHTLRMLNRLHDLGITETDALALRRISMTLHRWHELECGDSNSYGSWCIVRGTKHRDVGGKQVFTHDDNKKPYLERHPYDGMVSYSLLSDKEAGAKKRLAKILANYPHLTSYIQPDPRGCALYILKKSEIGDIPVDQIYNSRGIAVFK